MLFGWTKLLSEASNTTEVIAIALYFYQNMMVQAIMHHHREIKLETAYVLDRFPKLEDYVQIVHGEKSSIVFMLKYRSDVLTVTIVA